MSDLDALDRELERMLAAVAPGKRRATAVRIARALRQSQAARIAAQQNPDGSAFAPRRPREVVSRSGELKRQARARKMFAKIRRARHLRTRTSADEARVGFLDATVARIAGVHQHGLRDRVSRRPGAPEVTYPERRLIGFIQAEIAMVMDEVASTFD